MAITEQEILKAIEEAEQEQKAARLNVSSCKRAVMDAETRLIEANLHQEKLVEDLRVWRCTTVRYEPDARDHAIEDFRAKMPDLKKKGYL